MADVLDVPVLYIITRADLDRGRQAAQLVHIGDEWAMLHGYHGRAVRVYTVPTIKDLAFVYVTLMSPGIGNVVGFREPDLKNQLTVIATDQDPAGLGMELELLS